MLKIKEYVRVESLEEAYELNQKKTNRILGGMLWMRMSNVQIQKGIDLSGLGLGQIEETEEEFRIGCMVTLRQIEMHEGLQKWTNGIARACVKDIVGVQFRNLATVGGSIFGRFGFSDVLTAFMALDTQVELYKAGVMPIAEFAKMKKDNDILVRIIVKKNKEAKYCYLSHRNTKTDFPVLAVACAMESEKVKVIAGARPHKAMEVAIAPDMQKKLICKETSKEECDEIIEAIAKEIETGSNMRASKEFRTHLANVLIRRGLESLREKKEEGFSC